VLRSREDPILQHPRVEPFADQSQDHTIAHPSLEELTEMTMVDRVEKFSEIDVHDPAASQVHRLFPQRVQGSVCTASGAEAVGGVQEVRLIHRLQHHQHRALQDLILERGYPQRSSLARRARLGDAHSTHGRGHVRAGFGAVEEILKVAHQVVLVVVRGLSVPADGSVLASLGIRHVHPVDVDVMRQGREGHLRAVPEDLRGHEDLRGQDLRGPPRTSGRTSGVRPSFKLT